MCCFSFKLWQLTRILKEEKKILAWLHSVHWNWFYVTDEEVKVLKKKKIGELGSEVRCKMLFIPEY